MSRIKFVTFDVAGTLVDVRWSPVRMAQAAIDRLGLPAGEDAPASFARLFFDARRRKLYEQASLGGDKEHLREFWLDLMRFWLHRYGAAERAEEFLEITQEAFTAPGSDWFRAYPEAAPCLARLKASGWRLGVVSNWDSTLDDILVMTGLRPYFEVVVPSLVVGYEKPDPRIFEIALARMGAKPEETWHVGDLPEDDEAGAKAAGLAGVTLLRSSQDLAHVFDVTGQPRVF